MTREEFAALPDGALVAHPVWIGRTLPDGHRVGSVEWLLCVKGLFDDSAVSDFGPYVSVEEAQEVGAWETQGGSGI